MKPKVVFVLLAVLIIITATGTMYKAISQTGLVLKEGEESLTGNKNYRLAGSIYGPEERPLQRPLAVAVAGSRVYVADAGNGRITIYSDSGRFIGAFGNRGDSKAKLLFPTDLAIGPAGRVMVADRKAGLVKIYSKKGEFLDSLPEGNDRITLNGFSPLSIAVDKKGRMVVFDVSRQRLVFFNREGKVTETIGGSSEKDSGFAFVNGLAFGGDKNELYAANSNAGTILRVNQKNKTINPLPGLPGERMFMPRGAAIDNKGKILFFADPLQHKIYRYSIVGRKLIDDIGIVAGQQQTFSYPNDVDTDSKGRLFVADRENNRIVILEPVNS